MKTPFPTLLHRLFRVRTGRFPRWLLSRSGGRLDAVTLAIQTLLLVPAVVYFVVQSESAFTVTGLLFGAAYLAVAFVMDALLEAVLVDPARRMERVGVRAERRRTRLASPPRRGRGAVEKC